MLHTSAICCHSDAYLLLGPVYHQNKLERQVNTTKDLLPSVNKFTQGYCVEFVELAN